MQSHLLKRCIFAAAMPALILASVPPASGREQALSASELRRIEALIQEVEQLRDAAFIRNGKAYDAASAARFLRGKWRAREAEVRSAEDFIEKVATFSSTTGRPYLIRFRDGREIPSAAFLRERLARHR